MPYSAIKIANQILDTARVAGELLTPLQLIKLVYISHGWALALFGRPLLDERAQAWTYGPVIPSLYRAVREYRASPITGNLLGDTDPQMLRADEIEFLDAVYRRYRGKSGTQLSALTHQTGTPWSQVWETHGQNAIIPDDMIQRHYAERLDVRE